MQTVPAPAEAPHPAGRRRDGQRHQQHERRESHRDVGALGDVRRDRVDVEPLVEHEPVQEVQGEVSEREQPEHASHAHQPRLAQRDRERRHAKRREQQSQAPLAEPVHEFVHRVCAEPEPRDAGRARDQPRERQQAEEEEGGLEEATHGQEVNRE